MEIDIKKIKELGAILLGTGSLLAMAYPRTGFILGMLGAEILILLWIDSG